ncbi:hypothetical protein DEO72_LG10g3045 [Vigna unguiculata]|uniref:Uncharacterized protein n=1 Tax=Vigna unguiculata TaxID=3917 RepID=A0A4D6NEM6_VIGUN|nr:hypothetical protein DEO72_LG10g3045 [Vigna unguiculata]
METDSCTRTTTTTTKIQCWKDVVGGKTRGRVYGTRDMAANIHHGVSSLTQPSTLACTIHPRPEQFETERLLEEVKQVTIRADENDKKYAMVQEELGLVKKQLAMMLEKQATNTSTGTSRVHPHYNEDLDDKLVP